MERLRVARRLPLGACPRQRGLLAAVALTIDFGAARDKLSEGSWGWFVGAVAALFGSFLLAGLRWRLFLDAATIVDDDVPRDPRVPDRGVHEQLPARTGRR